MCSRSVLIVLAVLLLGSAGGVRANSELFRVDLGCPDNPLTFKIGWIPWAIPNGCDGRPNDGAFLEDIAGTGINAYICSKDDRWLRNIDGSGVDAYLTLGNEGMGALKVKGMRMHSKKGEGPPTDIPSADPICNTWYQSADWASHAGKSSEWGNVLLLLQNLPAGRYNLLSYHNHWYHCDRYECDCLGLVEYRGEYRANRAEQGPMPSIRAVALPAGPLPGYEKWSMPKGTGKGVEAIQNVYHFTAQHVEHDEELVPSVAKFKTDGSPVLIIYEAPQDYWDYRDYPGGRGILNAFLLEQVIRK
jgi:hypothetical protein